jgi:hypothetical protein
MIHGGLKVKKKPKQTIVNDNDCIEKSLKLIFCELVANNY